VALRGRRRAPPEVRRVIGPGGGLGTALSLFTVVPVAASARPELDPGEAARAVRWLPVVGVILSVPAVAVLVVVREATAGHGGRLLASFLALGLLALLTGGMHLDGLADTIDGLASRRSAAGTLEVMDRSDVGALGVTALVFTVGLQVAALAAIAHTVVAAGALVVAVVTGRTAVLTATGRSVPSARPGGFGALVTGSTARSTQVILVACVPCVVGAVAGAAGGRATAAVLTGACVVGLLLAHLVRRVVQRRIGGVTGDVFGALVEIATATVLVAAALAS